MTITLMPFAMCMVVCLVIGLIIGVSIGQASVDKDEPEIEFDTLQEVLSRINRRA